MIIVTHELGFASSVADRVVFMEEGRIVEEGAPDVILRTPKTERLKLFLEKINFIALKPKSDKAGHPTIDAGS